jgi:hypothetical protein
LGPGRPPNQRNVAVKIFVFVAALIIREARTVQVTFAQIVLVLRYLIGAPAVVLENNAESVVALAFFAAGSVGLVYVEG